MIADQFEDGYKADEEGVSAMVNRPISLIFAVESVYEVHDLRNLARRHPEDAVRWGSLHDISARTS